MMTKQQYADRLALIKEVAERRKLNGKSSLKTRAQKSTKKAARVVRDYTKSASDRFEKELIKLDENHNHWTDERQYAKQYYGEVAFETTRYDNDWD